MRTYFPQFIFADAMAVGLGFLFSTPAAAQTSGASLVCESKAGARQVCPADTSAGVVLVKATGIAACLLGKNWGYDDKGVWVTDGCGGEFATGAAALPPAPSPAPPVPPERIETWGEFDPGDGFLVGRGSGGQLSISGYALLRYLNQSPGEQTYEDHLGNERAVDGRNDFYPHRVMIFFKG